MNRLFMLLVVVALVYLYAADGRVDLVALRGEAEQLWQPASSPELAEAAAPALIEAAAVPLASSATMRTLEATTPPALTEEQAIPTALAAAAPTPPVVATPPATDTAPVPEMVSVPQVVPSPVIAQRPAAASQAAAKPLAAAPQDGMLPVTDTAVIRRRAEVLAFDEAVTGESLIDGGLAVGSEAATVPLSNTLASALQPEFMTAQDRYRELSNLVSELELLSSELEILR